MRKCEILLSNAGPDDLDEGTGHIVATVEWSFDVTQEQLEALVKLYQREVKTIREGNEANINYWRPRRAEPTLENFLRSVRPMPGSDPCVTVVAMGLTFGIETDGYTHT